MRFTLHGARLVDATSDLPQAELTVDDGRIQHIQEIRAIGGHAATDIPPPARDGPPSTDVSLDVSGAILVPGFIDVHTHGGGGCNLHTTNAAEIATYARWAASTGVTGFLVGVVGTPGGPPEEQLHTAALACAASARDVSGAAALGIHLEGPYISPRRRGAHPTSWLREPNPAETERVLECAGGWLRLITLAPELDGAPAMIRRMVEAGVTVSIGHTDATYAQTREALARGATHATHCCNAMRPLHHRHPGPLAALAETPGVDGELIADGVHVHPAMMRLLVKLFGVERTVVITDALAGAGSPSGDFEFNGQHAQVVRGVARLDDGTITGSVLTMDQALRNIVRITDDGSLSLSDAVAMLTRNPARSTGAASRKGRLTPGYDADLVLLDATLAVQATIRGGVLIYASEAWRERLAGIPTAEPTPVAAAPAVPASLATGEDA